MRSNITEVAKLAGVSISTVSRVLKGDYPVSEKARESVEAAVKELNYTTHFIASSLKSKQNKILGVIIPSLRNNVIMSMSEAIETYAMEHGYITLFTCSENNAEIEKKFLNLYSSSMVDGIMVATVIKDDSVFNELKAINMPVVLFDRRIDSSSIDFVGENGYTASYEMVSYLIKKGHRRIVSVSGVEDLSVSIERYNGYLDAMRDAGIPIDPRYQLCGNYREEIAYREVYSLLKNLRKQELPTAIFSANSLMTKGTANAILACGYSIPNDISLASYGHLDLPSGVRPLMACIKQDPDTIGKEVVSQVIKRINEKNQKLPHSDTVSIKVPTIFFEGESIRDLLNDPIQQSL